MFACGMGSMLMGNAPRFDDLQQIHPDIHSSLESLLAYDGDEEGMAAMSLFFQVGSRHTVCPFYGQACTL